MATYNILISGIAIETHGMMTSKIVSRSPDYAYAGDEHGWIAVLDLTNNGAGGRGSYSVALISPQGETLAMAHARAHGGDNQALMVVVDNPALPPGRLTNWGDSRARTFFNIFGHPHFTVGAKARVVCSVAGKFPFDGTVCALATTNQQGYASTLFGGTGTGELYLEFSKV